jgi:hypothetical protein
MILSFKKGKFIMETYIAILLLVIPGFIAEKVFVILNQPSRYISELNATISALIYSVFVLLVNYILIRIFGILSTTDFIFIASQFGSINFVITYIGLTIFSSSMVGFLANIFKPSFYKLINWFRIIDRKTALKETTSLLSHLNDGKRHLLRILKNSNTEVGFLRDFSIIDGNIKEIFLQDQEGLKDVDIDKIPTIGVYVIEDKTITEFDIKKYYNEKPSSIFCRKTKLLGLGISCGLVYLLLFFLFGKILFQLF